MTRALRLSLSAVALTLCLAPPAPTADAVTGRAAFERLKTLAGTWEGRAMDAKTGPPATVTYRVASGGTVVQETLFPASDHEMISMYHLVGGELVMTHYCAAGNQPRMKLDPQASTPDKLVFAFDGGTGFDPKKDGHVHSGFISWNGERLHNDWAGWHNGAEAGHHVFYLARTK
jgi:hypothetical protein